MEYTLILPNGQKMQFYVRSVAEMYQRIKGGRIVGRPELKLVDKRAA